MPLSAQWKSFMAGALVANSVPHLASGVTGHEHVTPLAGRRSSPVARAMIGKHEGDSISIDAPGGTRDYDIVSVEYVG